MQIRLTVLGSRSGHQTAPAGCDVLVTAPVGTALAAVASGLAATVGGPDTGGTVVLYAGRERLDLQRRVLGEPPLVDGAVLGLHAPVPDVLPDGTDGTDGAQLHVVAGPDAGGVHLLHPGAIRIGRSADADVPLDDPDVSRLHCAVTVMPDGRVAVADLDSTNGTTVDGAAVGPQPVALAPGALLRIGESTLRLAPDTASALPVVPDLEGHLSLAAPEAPGDSAGAALTGQVPVTDLPLGTPGTGRSDANASGRPGPSYGAPGAGHVAGPGTDRDAGRDVGPGPESGAARPGWSGAVGPGPDAGRNGRTGPAYGTSGAGRGAGPGEGRQTGPGTESGAGRGAGAEHGGSGAGWTGAGGPGTGRPGASYGAPGAGHDLRPAAGPGTGAGAGRAAGPGTGSGAGRGPGAESGAGGSAGPGSEPGAGPRGVRKRGFGAWARKWVRGEETSGAEGVAAPAAAAAPDADDPAALLLAALGPTRRLWSRPRGRLDVGLGAGSRVAFQDVGALGIAGPRGRLTGVARSVVAQLAALHGPGELEIVLLAADRARGIAERRADWGWLGWLPHVRPAHGQDCRLLLAYDRDQAGARTAELTRRLDDSPLGTHWAAADPDDVREAAYAHQGPYTLLVIDGEPGSGALRDLTGRLASHGPAAGIHVLVLAETPAATPASPLTETYEAACASSPAFRDCGAIALLSGDVATTVRTFTVTGGKPSPPGTTATADAVSAAWAERFARALAPLRAEPSPAGPRPAVATALPNTARLLDELGLARATPASLMARWAAATDQGQDVGGRAELVLGSGRRGPVGAELVQDGPHLLIEGPTGSGRTELLRSVAASLSAAARPDRLGLVLLDGAGGERGDGLQPCTELPHVAAHLVAADPVRMREFAQALGAELKRRSELLDGVPFAEWHSRRALSDRMVSPRQPSPGELLGDLDPQRSGTLRLRSAAPRTEPAGPGPLPRLVVLVDDFDALVAPGLGSTGRPAAGSVVRALDAVARDGARLGVHLVATSARPDRTADSELARTNPLRIDLDAPDQPGPGRGRLRYADGRTVPFQGGRVTGRIPRTATQRPTVVPVEWERMGDPPARRPVRELGNGPTDLALLASALDRASHLVSAIPVLFPPAP
ncbi:MULTISPECIES: FHA domain-containing protein [unclassified Streptomyces]|uniref:FHA domain-containing protein n=1 Tax=unclassified Streptomyces TaxID=2593676 RepID=UPI002E0F92D4|nr:MULTISPECIES: FHA domain-containing protein [unclassified Streptomyces]WSR26276.1 FHA domain-containing protein [Streptomyces sp. NBC_01205]